MTRRAVRRGRRQGSLHSSSRQEWSSRSRYISSYEHGGSGSGSRRRRDNDSGGDVIDRANTDNDTSTSSSNIGTDKQSAGTGGSGEGINQRAGAAQRERLARSTSRPRETGALWTAQ